MPDPSIPAASDADRGDQLALRMMLAYIEAECLRIGANEAARHAVLAASALPRSGLPPLAAMPLATLAQGARLH